MTDWTTIPNTSIETGKPIRAVDGRALRDNPIAIAEGATNAPPVKAGWYPYDLVNLGDGADGVIWDYAVDGAVSSVETPTFVSGFEYMIVLDDVGFSTALSNNFVADLYKSVDAAYQSVTLISGISSSLNGSIGLVENDYVKTAHVITSPRGIYSGSSQVVAPNAAFAAYDSTPQIISKMRVRVTNGNMNAGKILLYKRGGMMA